LFPTLLAMLLAAMNYSNNMAYILFFLILSLTVVALLYTRSNLRGLHIAAIQPQTALAGGDITFCLEIHNRSSGKRLAVYLTAENTASEYRLSAPLNIAPRSAAAVDITMAAPRRGAFSLSGIILVTAFPFGLFQVRRRLPVEKAYLVFPRPAGSRPWPLPEADTAGDNNTAGYHFSGGDDFSGLRPYRPGESQRHIHWKAVARGRPLSVKEFFGGGSQQLWFDWSGLGGMGTEARLSQLTRWVLEADQQNCEFGLRLPGSLIQPDSGSRHTLKSLRALALFNLGVGGSSEEG
jgi:uncharacterized protein (DUF58 family)